MKKKKNKLFSKAFRANERYQAKQKYLRQSGVDTGKDLPALRYRLPAGG